MHADVRIVRIIKTELGKKSADLFDQFYFSYPFEEQLAGAREILYLTIGMIRTDDLFKNLEKKK